MTQTLPSPATTTEMYLSAVLDELKGLRAELRPVTLEPTEGVVVLREPASPRARQPRPKRG